MDCDLIYFDATLSQEFFDISVGEPVSEVPTDGEHDYFGREPVTHERAAVDGCWPFPVMTHADTLARQQADPSTQQCPLKRSNACRNQAME